MIFRDIWRSVKKDRPTAALALVSMALGLATATVTLTIVDMTLLHPLPYPASEKIVEISQPEKSSGRSRAFSYRFFYDSLGGMPAALEPFEVIGVAGDVVSYNLKDHPAPTIYVPFDQMPSDVIQGFMTVLVRTTGNASNSYQVSRLAQTIKRAAPTSPANIQSLASIVAERSSTERFRALLMGAVSLIAVILASCGISFPKGTKFQHRRCPQGDLT